MPLALQRRTQGYFPCRATLAESAVALTSTVPDSITLVVNAAPTAIWVAPLDGSPIILSATASDSDGSISQVDFYNGTTLIGTVLSGSAGDTGSGYTTTWSNIAPGTYQLTAKATDNNGARVTTTPVTVTVNATAATIYYIHPDHLGTPRVITTSDTTNTKVWEWKNEDAFGNNAPNEDPSATGTAFKYNLRFPGQYFDQETGTSYNYFRDYDATIGRYVQSDPIGLRGGINTYAYVNGRPLASTDSTGLDPFDNSSGPSRPYIPGPFDILFPGTPANDQLVAGVNRLFDKIKDFCKSESPEEKKKSNCQALKDSILATCASLTGRKKFACFAAAQESYQQCMSEK